MIQFCRFTSSYLSARALSLLATGLFGVALACAGAQDANSVTPVGSAGAEGAPVAGAASGGGAEGAPMAGAASGGAASGSGEAGATGAGATGMAGATSTGGAAISGGATHSGGEATSGGAASDGGMTPAGGAPNIGGLPKITVFMAGDSTMANKPVPNEQNERGWGQMLQPFFIDQATISNHAVNGRSSKSFMDEGLWDGILKDMKAGDWVIVQFGHNDAKTDAARHTDPFTTYTENLKKYVADARAKGGIPIIATSVVRASLESHGNYPEAAIATANELMVPLLDLEATTKAYVGALADKKEFYIQADSTHLNEKGGTVVAQMAVDEMKRLQLPLTLYLK